MTSETAKQSTSLATTAAAALRGMPGWWSSEPVRHAFRVALAMVLAFYVGMSMGWERPGWAGLAVALCSLSTTGESVNKGLLRILGTMLAGAVVLVLNAVFPQERWAHLMFATVYIGFCAYMMGHSTRWYVWFIGGYVMALLALAGGPEGAASFEIVVLRLQQTTLGIIVYTVVAMLLWPQKRSPALTRAAGSLVDVQRRILQHGFARLGGAPEDPDFTKLRAQAAAGAGGLPGVVDGAEFDSLDVWEARHLWRRFVSEAAELNEVMARWHQGFPELERLDLGLLMPGVEPFAEEVDGRLDAVARMLTGEPPPRAPAGEAPALAGADALASLGAFDRAAVERSRDLLRRLDTLTRALFSTVDDIGGFAAATDLERPAPGAARAWSIDPDRLAYGLRAFVTVWIILLACIYVPDFPMPPGVIPVAAAIGIQLAVMPQMSLRELIVPMIGSVAVAGAFYLFVMPHLSGFAELGTGIFLTVFVLSVLLAKPEQGMARQLSVSFFPLIISVSVAQPQSYSFLFVVNFGLMANLALLAAWLATWFPISFEPRRMVFKQLGRFFRSCERLAEPGPPDGGRLLGPMQHRLDLFEVSTLPAKVRRWFAALPEAAYGEGTPQQGQDLVDALQVLGDCMGELVAARTGAQSSSLARTLAPDMRAWRLGIQEVLRGLDEDPGKLDADAQRARLDDKLQALEARIEGVLCDVSEGTVAAAEAAHMYRLLGAYRSVSEALVALLGLAAAIDWESLHETRF